MLEEYPWLEKAIYLATDSEAVIKEAENTADFMFMYQVGRSR